MGSKEIGISARNPIDSFNQIMEEALSILTSPLPDYAIAKQLLEKALTYFPDSADIKNLISECNEKINNRNEYADSLKKIMEYRKNEQIKDGFLECYLKSIKLQPLNELNRQYDKIIVKNAEVEQLLRKHSDDRLNDIIEKGTEFEKIKNFSKAYDCWVSAFRKRKYFSFVRKMVFSLLSLNMPIKASKLVLLIIEKYSYCFSQVEFNEKKVTWINSNINKILSNCKFIKSHIDFLNKELKELKKRKNRETEISSIERKLNLSKRKFSDITKTLKTFLLEQFFLD